MAAKRGGIHQTRRGRTRGENIDHVIGGWKQLLQIGNGMNGNGLVATGFLANGDDVHVQGMQQFHKAAGDGRRSRGATPIGR